MTKSEFATDTPASDWPIASPIDTHEEAVVEQDIKESTYVAQSAKARDSMYYRAKAILHSWIYFLMKLLPNEVAYLLLLVRFCWRHRILTVILGFAGLAAYGHFKIKEIQTENRTIHVDSILHIKWQMISNNEPGQDSSLGIFEVLKFLPGSGFNSRPSGPSAIEVAETIHKAAKDPRIIGLTCDFSEFSDDGFNLGPLSFKKGLNMAVLQEITHAITTFKNSKPESAIMIAYANTMCQNCYYVAAAFKQVYIQPFGEISFTGRRYQSLYYKNFLDNWNISATVNKGGRMKSLYDPYIRDGMDLETKEYHAELLKNLDEQFWYDIILSRQDVFRRQGNITNVCIENNKLMEDIRFCPTSNWKAEIARELKNAAKPGMVFGDLALTLGMIDGYRYARSVQAELKLKGTSLELNVYSARLKKNARSESNTQVRLPGSAVIKQDSQMLRLHQKPAIAQLKKVRSKSKSQVRHSASALSQKKLQTLLPLHLQSENKQSSSRRAAPKDQNSSSSDNAKSSNATIRIAQVRINGGILSNQNLENFVQNLDCIANDASISSIILRIDSSGGSFIASDTLSEAVQYAKAKKPVVASIGGMAASGAYYVAANASKIIANRGSLIGSIGVTSMVLDFSTFLQRFGVTYESLYVGVPATIFETQTEEQAAARETRVQYLYQKFVEHVGKHRQIPHEVVDEHLAQGRLFTGEQAFYNGLIDGLGGMQFAKETACDLVKKQNVAKWNTAVCEVIDHRCIPSNSFNLKSLID